VFRIFDNECSTATRLFSRETAFWRQIIPALIEAISAAQHGEKSPFAPAGDEQSCDAEGNCG